MESRINHELRMRANANVLAMIDADENGWVDALLADLADAPLLREAHTPGVRSVPSPAELRVLSAMSHGLTVAMTADLLGVSSETVKTQLQSVRLRLRAKNTAHAVCIALREGYLK